MVAVGNKLCYSKSWKTFHDFLIAYLGEVFGKDWGNAELKKHPEEAHPLVQWYRDLCEFQRQHFEEQGKIHSPVASGPVMAYLWLAYDLYTLAHQSLLQARLVKRLKVKRQFQGVRYETSVAAAYVRAGFDVVLEDETDTETSHCEFNATHRETGQKYSIEAKSRHRAGLLGQSGLPQPLEEIKAEVYSLLQKALSKKASFERIVFVDVNVPPEEGSVFESGWFKRVADQVNLLEQEEVVWPPAFVFFTNHPYHYVGNDQAEPGRSVIFSAISMPEFKEPNPNTLMRYPAIKQLFDSIIDHTQIPHEFE